jgi:molybdenum cofactor synthesis domain-containing protein
MTQSISSTSASLAAIGLSISQTKGQPHTSAAQLHVSRNGIEGDRHAGPGLRQISLMHRDVVVARFPEADPDRLAGLGQENILVEGEGLGSVRLLDTLELGDALLEVTQIGKRVNESGQALCGSGSKCLLGDFGLFTRVVHGGTIATGHAILHQQRVLRAHVITVSDRASRGDYADQSGPAALALLETWCKVNHWTLWAETQIVPDEAPALDAVLNNARGSQVDVVITTGGTGVGPRDITPDVVAKHADKIIPGIMEFIRLKHGERMPLALTSRSVAAVMGTSLVYTLPGGAKAIPEYLEEIFKSMEHMILILKGLDAH